MGSSLWYKGLILVLLLLAACGGAASKVTPGPGQQETAPPSEVVTSCDAIGEIQSYRYFISLRLQSPAFQEPTPEGTEAPLSGFAEQLNQLFSDMQLEGAFVAPDRTQAVMRFGEEEMELRVIGDKSWLRVGSTWQEQSSPPGPDTLPTPRLLCQNLVQDLGPSLSTAQAREEIVNGVATVRYRLDETNLEGLARILGKGSTEELPQQFSLEVWLAKEGGWPVRLQISASDQDEEGRPISLELFMEFRDINDPNIEIEPPPLSPSPT